MHSYSARELAAAGLLSGLAAGQNKDSREEVGFKRYWLYYLSHSVIKSAVTAQISCIHTHTHAHILVRGSYL